MRRLTGGRPAAPSAGTESATSRPDAPAAATESAAGRPTAEAAGAEAAARTVPTELVATKYRPCKYAKAAAALLEACAAFLQQHSRLRPQL